MRPIDHLTPRRLAAASFKPMPALPATAHSEPDGFISPQDLTLMAKNKNAAAAASQSANAAGSSSPGDSETRWWVIDETTKRVNTATNPVIAKQIADVEASTLPAAVKASAIAGLRAQLASEKPLTLAIARATKPGLRDLVAVSGSFKNKNLSPTLVSELVAYAPFVSKFLADFNSSDE